MYSVEADSAKRFFVITAAGHVRAEEVAQVRDELRGLVEGAAPDLAVLTDFRMVESMKPETAHHIGEIMDVLAANGLKTVVRVIPDPNHDVGMNILSRLHYGEKVEIFTVTTLAEAIVILSGPEG